MRYESPVALKVTSCYTSPVLELAKGVSPLSTFEVSPPKTGKERNRQLAELLLKARAGDTYAEETLYSYLYPYMRAECRRMFPGRPEDAEDALQNTMMKIAEKQGTLKDPEALLGWCYKVCHSVCYNYQKAEGRRAASGLDGDGFLDENLEDMPGFALEREEIEALGQDILETLPEKQRAVYAMVLEGASEGDIAEKLDMPLGSVKSSRRYAKEKLSKEAKRLERDKKVAFRGLGDDPTLPILAVLLAVLIAIGLALSLQTHFANTGAQVRPEVAENSAQEQEPDEEMTASPEEGANANALTPTEETPGPVNPAVVPTPNPGGGGGNNGPNQQPTVAGQQYIRPDGTLTAVTDTSDWSDILEPMVDRLSEQMNTLGPLLPDTYRKAYIASAQSTYENDILKVESVIMNFTDHTIEVLGVDNYVVPTVDGRQVAKGTFVFDRPLRLPPNSSSGASLYFPEGYYDAALASETQQHRLQGIYELSNFVENSYKVNYRVVD